MHTFTLNFYLKRQKTRKDGTAPIYARITVDGKRAEFALKRYIAPKEWNAKRGEVVARRPATRELSTYLEAIRTKLYVCHRQLIDRGAAVTATSLKDEFFGRSDQGKTLVASFEYHLQKMEERRGTDFAPSTIRKAQTTLKHTRTFLQHQYGVADMPLKHLQFSFITYFDHYLRTEKGIGNNATVKYISIFRKFINLSIQHGWLEVDPFLRYQGKSRTQDRVFLTQEELARIEQRAFPFVRLDLIRDVFLFACYTGLAFSDVAKLNADHLQRHLDGNIWIDLNRTKTKTKSLIPLLPMAKAILDKYADDPDAKAKGTLLPVKSNQKTNAYLKEIADLCGINKPLTFHIARHTFATTVTLSNGVPIESVSAMLGHRSIKTTQHYAKVVQRKVGEDMKALQEKLYGQAGKPEANIKKIS